MLRIQYINIKKKNVPPLSTSHTTKTPSGMKVLYKLHIIAATAEGRCSILAGKPKGGRACAEKKSSLKKTTQETPSSPSQGG